MSLIKKSRALTVPITDRWFPFRLTGRRAPHCDRGWMLMILLTFDLGWLADADLRRFVSPESSLWEWSGAGVRRCPGDWSGGVMGLGENAGVLLSLWNLVVAQNVGFPQAEAGDSSAKGVGTDYG